MTRRIPKEKPARHAPAHPRHSHAKRRPEHASSIWQDLSKKWFRNLTLE
jgi:hypothetical protein